MWCVSLHSSIDRTILILCPNAAANDKVVKIWSPFTGELIRNLNGHTKGLSDIAWSADSVYLASASDDHTVRVWDVDSVRIPSTYVSLSLTFIMSGFDDKSVERTLKLCILRELQYVIFATRLGWM